MSFDSTTDFQNELEDLPALPKGERGEWVHNVRSSWVDGVFFEDRQDPNMTVALERVANNEEGYEPVLHHEVTVQFGDQRNLQTLRMSAQSAITLGHHLIMAGTAAMRDTGKHAWFLSEEGQ